MPILMNILLYDPILFSSKQDSNEQQNIRKIIHRSIIDYHVN